MGVSKLSKMPVSRANLEKRELSSEEPSDSPAGGAKGAGELRRRAAEKKNKSARGTHGPQNPQTTGTQLVARRPLSESELERVVEERGQEEHPCAGVFNLGNLRKNPTWKSSSGKPTPGAGGPVPTFTAKAGKPII